jgi:hypothetical protein
MSCWLIIFGVLLIAAGLLWPLLEKLGLGHLPSSAKTSIFTFRSSPR